MRGIDECKPNARARTHTHKRMPNASLPPPSSAHTRMHARTHTHTHTHRTQVDALFEELDVLKHLLSRARAGAEHASIEEDVRPLRDKLQCSVNNIHARLAARERLPVCKHMHA